MIIEYQNYRGEVFRPEVSRLGSGLFSKVYKTVERKPQVLILTNDICKRLLADINPHNSRYLPKIKIVGRTNERDVYKMKLLNRLTKSASPFAWKQFQILKKACAEANRDAKGLPKYMSYKVNLEVINIARRLGATRGLLKAVTLLVDMATNYGGDIAFDVCQRNCAIEGRQLILLDCLYSTDAAAKVRYVYVG